MTAGLRKLDMDRGDLLRTLLGVLILAFAAYSTLLTYQASDRLAEVAACQSEQNRQFAEALTARSAATTRGNAAQRVFLNAVADPAIGPAETEEAFRRYLAALDEIDASRAANPLTLVECT